MSEVGHVKSISTAAVLVLFILLVIVSASFLY
ncbi:MULTISPECIES: YjcZ family sporulation protein [unclassified Paenibacillus]|nr:MULTISPECIES: YjcZ family sporulation protein [unclassified Paenibacillus]QID16076.1 YjcZ family sporulation protein [Paenibacillus sp. RUD330]SIQ23077.1 conserved hypothetical tiny transmembrane protein [Paenibacillus sp. RU4X]SIQ44685.1 conserved hypothetical tiny transmembrane protein [Paenibacillus sp. RU4T]